MNILTKRVLKQVINEQINKTFTETNPNDTYNYKKEITIEQLKKCFERIIDIIAESVAKQDANTD